MEQLSLREIERRASLFYGDGLVDIGIGIGVLALGVIMIFGLGAAAGLPVVVLIPLVRSMRRRITFPRMHHFDFMPDPYTASKVHRVSAIVAVAIVSILPVAIFVLLRVGAIPARAAAWLRSNTIIAFSLVLAVVFLVIAWGTGVRRLVSYAALTFVALVCGYWFNVVPAFYFMGLGLVILFCGSMVLARFVHKYPRIVRGA
jgi:hypothetical protein